MQATKLKPGDRVADVVSTLVVLNRGNFIIEAGRELQELTDAIIDTNQEGELSIKLKVKPSGWKDGRCNELEIRPIVDIKKPKHEQGKSVFFVTADNKLVRDDPNQMTIDEQMEEQERETNGRRG